MNELQAVSTIVTALVALYAAYTTYKLGQQRNVIDANKTVLEDLTARQDAAEKAAESRRQAREQERELDRKDRESAAEERRKERESDLHVMELYRQQVVANDKDIREVRDENRTLTRQMLELSHRNDTLERDFQRSETDRHAKTELLLKAQTELTHMADELRNANSTIVELRTEMQHQHDLHEVRLEGLNELNSKQNIDFQRQIDQIKADHHAQLEQIQISEIPRQREITHLRFTLREVNKHLSQGQVEEITHVLEERGIQYEALLFPKPDPILLMPLPGPEGDPPPGGAVNPLTGMSEKVA